MLPLPGITKLNLPPCKSSHLQSVNKLQPAAFCTVYHKNGGGGGEGERSVGCALLKEDTFRLRPRTVHVVPFHSDSPHARSAGPVRKKAPAN